MSFVNEKGDYTYAVFLAHQCDTCDPGKFSPQPRVGSIKTGAPTDGFNSSGMISGFNGSELKAGLNCSDLAAPHGIAV